MLSTLLVSFVGGLFSVVVVEIFRNLPARQSGVEDRLAPASEILETVSKIPAGALRIAADSPDRQFPLDEYQRGSPLHRLYLCSDISALVSSEYESALCRAFSETTAEDAQYYIHKVNPKAYAGPFRNIVALALVRNCTKR